MSTVLDNSLAASNQSGGLYDVTHFIGGKRVPTQTGRYGEIFNPAKGRVAGRLHLADEVEVGAAVASAKAAFAGWAQTPPLTRARVMFRFLQLMQDKRDAMAEFVRTRVRISHPPAFARSCAGRRRAA